MENEFDLNEQGLLHFLTSTKVNDSCGGHEDFFGWNNETVELKSTLKKIGSISIKPSENQWDSEYWGKDTIIELDKYPYYGCEIFQCTKCNTVFFYYLEVGGHGAQHRYRVVRKELIDLKSIKPLQQIVIESKGYDYSIYKNPDLTYGISISINLGIGADVYHQLSTEEAELYIKEGITSLTERRTDMETNYNNYKVTSWR